MKTTLMTLAIAAALASSGMGYAALSKEERKSEQERIDSNFKAARQRCNSLSGNARDICVAEANGAQKVAKADLEARDKGTAKAQENARIARAKADYAVAKEKCDDMAGNVKDVCLKDAKAALTRAEGDAKVGRTALEADKERREKVADARRDADQHANQAAYDAARERCDTFAGDAKDRCISDAKARFGK